MIGTKKTMYSAIQPTGAITLGNYIGAIRSWLRLADEYRGIFAIADLHALTVRQEPAEYRRRALSFFAQYIACGLDPEKTTMYFQSHVSEHAELTWILNCATHIGEASRMTQFKDKSRKNSDNVNMGLLDYPVLMAADILLYQTDYVPVGADQKQHLELSRLLAERFNAMYSPTFVVPEPYIETRAGKIYSLQDPRKKMSKSDANPNATVNLLDSPDDIVRKFKRAVTDSEPDVRYDPERKPGVSNLMNIVSCAEGVSIESLEAEFAGKGYAELKRRCGETVVELLRPIRERYFELENNRDYLLGVARRGAEAARKIASATLRKAYRKVGLVQI